MAKSNVDINIMMLGGRRCGKTSVLASMQGCFDEKFGATNLTINIEDMATIRKLTEKRNEISGYYKQTDRTVPFHPDAGSTKGETSYDLSISLKSKKNGKINFHLIDYPGEYFSDGIEAHDNAIENYIKKSQVFLIAIDTPYLMELTSDNKPETVGDFNEARNRSDQICEALKTYLQLDNSEMKMILFVPLKCERYREEGRMDEVCKKIKTAYRALIDHINNEYNASKCMIAITPIFTMGTLKFVRFERDEEYNYIMAKGVNPTYPQTPLYRFMDEAADNPSPMYCEQPFIYVLLYLLQTAAWAKSKKLKPLPIPPITLIYLIQQILKMPSIDDFLLEINNLKNEIKLEGDGYELITDPLMLKK